IEAKFVSPEGGELMLIAWFEANSVARLVMSGPAGEREEVQIKSIDASLDEDVKLVLDESMPPPGKTGPVTAKLKVATDRARVGRAIQLGNKASRADNLCTKLVAMAELMSRDEGVKRSIDALKQQIAQP